MMYRTLLISLLLTSNMNLADEKEVNPFKNFHKVDPNIYRSEQPSKKGMQFLKNKGIKTIINLRESQKDDKKSKGLDFTLEHYPISTWKINENDLVSVLKIIKSAKGPILIHCKHGSDRTGCIIAAYRIIFQQWTKEKALQELRMSEFGYHEFWFPDIVKLINNLDINRVKGELNLNP